MSFVHPAVLSEEPIPIDRSLRAKFLVQFFRQASTKLDDRSILLRENTLVYHFLQQNCGNQLIEAYQCGLIPDNYSDLREVILWHLQPNPPTPPEGGIGYVHGPANLFTDVIGANMIKVKWINGVGHPILDDKGQPKRTGGLMPRMIPGYLALSRIDQWKTTCTFLADVIEEAAKVPLPPKKKGRGSRGQSKPPDTKPKKPPKKPIVLAKYKKHMEQWEEFQGEMKEKGRPTFNRWKKWLEENGVLLGNIDEFQTWYNNTYNPLFNRWKRGQQSSSPD